MINNSRNKNYLFGPEIPRDAWGNHLRYSVEDGRPVVWSLGQDGEPDTEDDIVVQCDDSVDASSSDDPRVYFASIDNDVEITIDPRNTTVFKGEHVIVAVTISNEGQEDFRLAKQYKLYRTQARFHLEIVEGQPISQTAMAPPPGVLRDDDYRVLAPGQRIVDEVVFERDVYWSIAEPGSMDISVRLAMTGHYMQEKPHCTSNKVRIKVLDIPEKERDGFRRVLLKRVKQDGKQYIDKVLVGEADIPGQENPVTVALHESEIGTIWRTER